ncbi:MAG: amidohydrolase [Bauldia sp.]|nr:amidohydrolase [Bauldia sp.]
MPIINRLAEVADEIAEWRHDIHRNPELLYEVHRTAGVVADKLRSFGVDEVVTGIGRTGVVGVIRGRSNASGRVIGLRADMDALPIEELTGKPYASANPGLMHACGHDGHTAMLLGAARHLSETRNFDGTAIMIFQPAEEGGAGGKAMVEDGLMDRFGIQEVYGMHNMPGIRLGHFALRPGPMMASTDEFKIEVTGRGGHAAMPHQTVDPIVAASAIVQALQTIVSRNVAAMESAVVTVTRFNAGTGSNIIPDFAKLTGTVRTLQPAIRDLAETRLRAIVEQTAAAYGTTATIAYKRNYPVTVNHPAETEAALRAAAEVAGTERVDPNTPAIMGAEDFAYMLEARPGAFIFIGNGDSAGLHNPTFDFDDSIIPLGCSYWVRLVETTMPA